MSDGWRGSAVAVAAQWSASRTAPTAVHRIAVPAPPHPNHPASQPLPSHTSQPASIGMRVPTSHPFALSFTVHDVDVRRNRRTNFDCTECATSDESEPQTKTFERIHGVASVHARARASVCDRHPCPFTALLVVLLVTPEARACTSRRQAHVHARFSSSVVDTNAPGS